MDELNSEKFATDPRPIRDEGDSEAKLDMEALGPRVGLGKS